MYFFTFLPWRLMVYAALLVGLGVWPVNDVGAVGATQYWTIGSAVRLAGQNRYETATKVSEFEYGAAGVASEIVVASGENFPDGIVAAPFAAFLDAPLVL